MHDEIIVSQGRDNSLNVLPVEGCGRSVCQLPRLAMPVTRVEGRVLLYKYCSLQGTHAHWACQPGRRKKSSSRYHVFVGGLASDVDDNTLFNAFIPYRCTKACIVWDRSARRTKGYGFVEFR